jgi:hypothetical protein
VLAVDVDLFSRGGLAILDRIAARGFDVLSARPALTKWTKVRLLGHALLGLGLARLRKPGARGGLALSAKREEGAITPVVPAARLERSR